MQLQNSNSKLSTESAEIENTPAEILQNWLVDQLAEIFSKQRDEIEIDEPLTRYGLDSIDAVTLVGDLEDWLDLELPSTLFWDYQTIKKATQYLISEFEISETLVAASAEPAPAMSEEPQESKKSGWGAFFRGK